MNALPPIVLGPTTPIPTLLTLTASPTTLTQLNQSVQITVTGTYSNASTANLTGAGTGTQYRISNPALATISANGTVTALKSGTVLVQATNEGTQGLLQLMIALSGDSDGDGIPDDIELANGLNPNDPADALEDADRDGLTNRDELLRGTLMRNPDTDGDGLTDGEEVNKYHTNPLLADSDGDGVPDNVEIATGSDPNNAASVNLAQALKKITVTPANFVINIDSVQGMGSRQLAVIGEFNLGGTINLTSKSRGTNYASSNLQVCNFGAQDGLVFGAADGVCTITVTNNGFSAAATGVVRNNSPTALSFVSIPGFANNVDISGDYAYVAAGAAGLQVVNVANKSNPQVVASRDTPGNANDVVVVGNYAYIADDTFGLQIFNIANPLNPVLVGSLIVGGTAWDVVVRGNHAFIANGAGGLRIINVTNPAVPILVGSLALPGTAKGVDVDPARALAVVASGTNGLHVISIANLGSPALLSTLPGGDVRDVVLSGAYAILADFSRSMTTVDLTNPASPVLRASTPSNLGGLLQDVAVSGSFALGADVLFVNGVPIVDVSNPASPQPRAILNFSAFRDDNGTGIAADSRFVYMTAERGITENGTIGDTRLYIGQFLTATDTFGVPPLVSITSPGIGGSVIRGTNLTIRANATDDIAVVSVIFNVNGVDVFADTSSPFEAVYAVPSNATVLTIIAKAIDLGNNVGTSTPVTVTAIPDPLTTVTGRVLRQDTGAAVVGATVTCLGSTGLSVAAGAFSFPGLPTIQGDITCNATMIENALTLRGSSAAKSPVPAGITAVGDIILRSGSNILLLSDIITPGTSALVNALNAAGNVVTLRAPPEFTWDATNPPLTGFGCVVHLDGSTYSNPLPVSGQQALVNFVSNSGGGYITQQWMGFERSQGITTQMNDLILLSWGTALSENNCVNCSKTYNKIPAQATHPLMAGIPDTFTFIAEAHDAGALFGFSGSQPLVLMQVPSGGPAVVTRQVNLGRVVNFSIAPNYLGTGQTLLNANILKLYVNAVAWACK